MPDDDDDQWPWRTQPAFDILCDIIASDSLVCVTGAGVSFGLRRADGSGTLPSWKELLKSLFERLKSRIAVQDLPDCESIVKEDKPPGSRLIELASILRKNNEKEFDELFRPLVTPEEGAVSDQHLALLELQPRGTITFNYDSGHENAAKNLEPPLDVFLPTDEEKFANALNQRLSRQFLLKAHGSIDGESPLVLTYESYRQLLVKSPAYRSFVENILTNFHLLIVGFGLSDPDFDVFINTLVSQYGSPLREHVVIRGPKEFSNQEIELRRRHGIHTLYVDEFENIPRMLVDAATSASNRLKKLLQTSVYGDMEARGEAHKKLQRLGPAGRRSAVEELKKENDRLSSSHFRSEHERLNKSFYLSEIVYSLGTIDARLSKPILMEIVNENENIEPTARALTVLRGVLEKGDIPKLIEWRDQFKAKYLSDTDEGYRLGIYAEYLVVYVGAKFSSLPKY